MLNTIKTRILRKIEFKSYSYISLRPIYGEPDRYIVWIGIIRYNSGIREGSPDPCLLEDL